MKKCVKIVTLFLCISLILAPSALAATTYQLNYWYATTYKNNEYMIGRWRNNPTYVCSKMSDTPYAGVPLGEKTSAAVSQWNNALGISCSQSNNDWADIQVNLGTRLEVDAAIDRLYNEKLLSTAVGYTKPNLDSDNVTFVKGQIQAKGQSYLFADVYILYVYTNTTDDYYSTILHEMGHAFGYMGEGLYSNDVMCPTTNGVTTLTLRDKNHLKQVYDYWRAH